MTILRGYSRARFPLGEVGGASDRGMAVAPQRCNRSAGRMAVIAGKS